MGMDRFFFCTLCSRVNDVTRLAFVRVTLQRYHTLIMEIKCFQPSCSSFTKKRCGKCYQNYYCSRECQSLDWKRHKPNCIQIVLKEKRESIPNLLLEYAKGKKEMILEIIKEIVDDAIKNKREERQIEIGYGKDAKDAQKYLMIKIQKEFKKRTSDSWEIFQLQNFEGKECINISTFEDFSPPTMEDLPKWTPKITKWTYHSIEEVVQRVKIKKITSLICDKSIPLDFKKVICDKNIPLKPLDALLLRIKQNTFHGGNYSNYPNIIIDDLTTMKLEFLDHKIIVSQYKNAKQVQYENGYYTQEFLTLEEFIEYLKNKERIE